MASADAAAVSAQIPLPLDVTQTISMPVRSGRWSQRIHVG